MNTVKDRNLENTGRPNSELGAQTGDSTQVQNAQTGRPEGGLDAQLGVQNIETGRPDAQRAIGGPEFDANDEDRYPSRVNRTRLHLRLDAQLLRTVRVECNSVDPHLNLYEVVEDGLRLWLEARRQAKLGAQKLGVWAPTCSSSGSSGYTDLDQKPSVDLKHTEVLTTTTTTLGAQTPKSPPLPGFAADVLDLNRKSRHSLEVNLAYAWEAHRNDQGIKSPDVWATSNFRTGKYDALLDMWVERKRQEEELRQQQEARYLVERAVNAVELVLFTEKISLAEAIERLRDPMQRSAQLDKLTEEQIVQVVRRFDPKYVSDEETPLRRSA